ncbi:hypothetical protein SGUI_0902 [Serinicoccus hydrothermalis]|uniref:Uncharacterized protein n=1 Tax=Serinicoccus hydrothermalis TaxID=1758689 RepID=A0A1B1NA59_9MICO|nr:hypothetical protein [Serinicoccus hydrothermalis]ANS78298.1 hypothetical protein SGUI_0902 [Serinicoccus hydrothermalis]
MSQQRDEHADRLTALRRHRGTLTGVYPTYHLEQLREDWPR